MAAPGADEILLLFLLLAAIALIWNLPPHAVSPPRNPILSFVIECFLVWRVSLGGRISRMVLIIS